MMGFVIRAWLLPRPAARLVLATRLGWLACLPAMGAALPVVPEVEWQPFSAQARRVLEALEFIGEPLPAPQRAAVEAALAARDPAGLQAALDARCLFGVHINGEMRVKVQAGPARPELMEQGWRSFLVKVHNEAATTAALEAISPNALSLWQREGRRDATPSGRAYRQPAAMADPDQLWLDLSMYDRPPLRETLGGLNLEYRIVQLFSRDAGRREAKVSFHVGQGTQDLGFRSETDILFECRPARPITLRVRDENGRPTMAAFEIRDALGRVYPLPSKRLEPDFFFHPQVYRADGETVRLPAGRYSIHLSRGPESVPSVTALEVSERTTEATFQVQRWIDPSLSGWWSGDHHIHAAGCAHYVKPTEGVRPEAMIRHVKGEDLKVGANLTWGPGFDFQKQFFCGTVDKVSEYPHLLRYDVEVSQFGSHESGHLVLLRLKDQIYPGGDSKHHWPKLGLNTLKWAKAQGAITGPAHSGWGLTQSKADLPTFELPPFNGIGANEYIVDVTHQVPGPDGLPVPAVDFLSTVDTPYVYELNIWYHTLNAGFRTRISGETDFPCIYGERVGLGRSYVKLDGKLDYDAWCEGIRLGRAYVGDGRSHLMEFSARPAGAGAGAAAVAAVRMGEQGSELRLARPGPVRFTVRAAARLHATPDPGLQQRPYHNPPYWHLERARLGQGREVPVELVVNGWPVARTNLLADGQVQDLAFEVEVPRSSWVALRILPSSHTNPIFVLVDGKPVRASRRSVDWCLRAVDRCWSEKERFYRAEVDQARAAYEHARVTYRRILQECEVE
ncbi:MAG: hypothetical protein RJA22_2174 [Verrucomicrobiota bacterium]